MLIGIYISHYPIYNLIYLLDTLNNLAMSGCEIDLYLQNAGHKLPEFGPNINLVVLPFNYVSAAHSRVAPYYSLIPAVNLEIIRKAAPKRKYDYCIGIEPMGLIMAKEAADAANCPLGYLSYELYERSNPGVWGNDFEIIKEVERRIVPELDLFLIQDTAREEAYYRLLNAEGRPKNVIYFPVSLGPVKSSNKPNYWREKYGLSPDTKIALYFGQLGKSRFIDQMIINAKRFSPDIVLIIKAWVSGKNEYFDYLRSLDTSGRVIFDTREISWDERWELIASADAGVVFYRNDLINDYLTGRASDKTAAYMQSGIPVVCPDYPTFQEVVDHYHNGVCVDDFSGLPGALDEIFNNYEVFKSGARKAFNEVYDSSKYIDKILNHIKTGTGSTILSSEGELKYSNENLSKGLNEIKRAADEGRNERGQAIFKKLLVDFPNNETLLNIYQNNSFSLTWDDIKTFTEVNLYAGDIPESDRYRGRIGISIEKTDFRHIYHDVTQHFPLPDNSVDSFQAEDVFEHIAYEKLPAVFNEIYRVLKPGATFRLSIPDYGCDILIDRSLKDTDGKIIFDPGGGGTIENPGHVWLPLFSNVKPLLEKTKFAEAGKIEFLHHYNGDGTFVLKDIDYSKGFVKRNPDNDERVQNPRRPMSIIVDLVKDDSIEPEKSLDEIAEDIYPNDIYSRIEIEIANKNYDASKELCYQVLSEDPDNYKTYLYMGDINAAESDDLKALHNYESAYKLSNNGRAAGLKLAQIYHSKGDGARLKKVMDKLAADYPDDRTILKLYQALNVDPDSGKNEIPVILITYNRPDHTARVIDSLRIHNVQNLFVFSDAPKTKKDDESVRLTRDLIKTIDWTIPEIVYQKENQGLAKSIISAVDYVFTKFDKVILLEDDCVPQKYFFDFMTRCLNQYENNEKIYGVSGYSVPVPDSILKNYSHDLYFYPRIGSWGWGTWKDRWRKKEDDLKKLLTQLNERKIDIGRYGNDILQTIVGLVNGNVKDVWTINWLLTVYLNEGFYIYPTKSHIMNIGMDGTGVHCGKTDKYDIKAADKLPESYPENVVLDERIMGNFRKYYDLNYDSVATNKEKSNKLKVVHLCAADFGGAGKAAYRLHKGLLSAGVDSTLITAIKNSNDPSVKVLPEHASNGTAECGNPPSYQSKLMNDNYTRWWGQLNEYPDRSKSIELFTDTKSSFNLEAVKGIAEADIINFHWVAGLLDYEKIADVFKGKKIVWTLHDMNPFTGGCHYSHGCEKFRSGCGDCPLLNSGTVNDLSKKIFKTKEEAYKKLNIHLVTPSKWLGKEAKISKLFTAFPLTVIPNGFPVEVFSNGDKREIRRKLGIPEHSNVILFGADNVVNERKGFIYLLQALSKLNINENIVLVTFGKLEAQLNFNGKFKHIDLGPISNENDLSTIYNLADVFMLPSLQDNLPNTAVEAMLCGTPVVAFNTGGLSDIIEHKKNGYLAELKNVDDLAGGVIWALKNNSESLSAYCRKTAEDKFSIEIQAKKYLALYENILSGADDNITSHPASNYKNITFDEKKAEEKRVTGNLPIVLVNLGDNDHLKYTLAQAKIKNPGSDVYLICEPNKDNYDYAIHEDINKYSGKAFKFQKYYKHYSTNVHNIEMFCFLRWFILEEFMAAHNFEKCVYIDSDVLLYKNISEEAENFNRYDFTLSNGQSPHTAFVNNFVFLKEFNEYLFECYTNDEWHKQSKQYFEQRISNGEPGGFCDMTLFSDFTRLGKFNVGDISEIVNDGRFDHNINVAEDFETEKGIKKIYWSDGKPFCKNKETGKFIEFKSLHFQGTAKNSVNQYFHGKIEISEESGKWKISDNSIKVSAIVSTYNSERFLRGCLDDLTTQTLYQKSELEIIVVNSGSEQNEEKI